MPRDKIIVEAASVEEAIHRGCQALKTTRDKCNIEILKEPKKGLLGLFSGNAQVKLTLKKNISQPSETHDEFDDFDVFEQQKKELNIEDPSIPIDGYCRIESDEDGVYLLVFAPKNDGKSATLDDAQNVIEAAQIVNIDYNSLQEALENQDGARVKIADFDPELYKNAEMEITVSPDRMKTEIVMIPPQGGMHLTPEQIVDKLKKNGIVFGINVKKIEEIVSVYDYNTPHIVATGIEPVHGENSRVSYKFDLDEKKIPTQLEDGKVDFKDLNLITNVLQGEILAEKNPATKGIPGKNVFNEDVPARDGVDHPMMAGKNTELIDNGLKLISKINGQVEKAQGMVSVNPVYIIEGDVCYETGNIDFIGNVVIKGSVLDEFEIRAQGTVEIEKAVGAANIHATGNIIVKGGILGKDKGDIFSEGNVYAKFIENSNVKAKGDIIVDKAIMNSKISAQSVWVGGKKGLIVGGEIFAKENVVAKTLGSYASKTQVTVGIDDELFQRLAKIDDEISEIYRKIDKLNNAITLMAQLKQRIKTLPPEKEQILIKSIETKKQLENAADQLEEEKEKLDMAMEQSKAGKVRIKEIIYPGVHITIRKGTYIVKDIMKYTAFYYNKGFVEIQPYE